VTLPVFVNSMIVLPPAWRVLVTTGGVPAPEPLAGWGGVAAAVAAIASAETTAAAAVT
jgi:hypothetical protein